MLKKVKLQLQLVEEVFSKILMRAGFFYNQKRLIEFEKITPIKKDTLEIKEELHLFQNSLKYIDQYLLPF